MNHLKEIIKARKLVKSLMRKEEKVFNDLLDKIGVKEPEHLKLSDKIYDYLYNGTSFSLGLIKQELNNKKTPKSWWHRK